MEVGARSQSCRPVLWTGYPHSGNSSAPEVQTLGQLSWCKGFIQTQLAIQVIQCWHGLCLPEGIASAQLCQWQMCLQTRGGLQTRVTSIHGAAGFQKLGFVLVGTSAACGSCTVHVNAPSDSISIFYPSKRRYLWSWWSNHVAKSVSCPAPRWFCGPQWTVPPSQVAAFQALGALLSGTMAALT